MAAARSPMPALAFTVVMLGLSVAAWWWRSEVMGSTVVEVPSPPWEHVQERFPMPPSLSEVPSLPPKTLQAFIEANPFSSLRRYVPLSPEGVKRSPEAPPGEPVLKYKGRIQLGQRQRAVLEDVTAGKTHFLEVGQGVAGYKVLDISEVRVLLSDLQTDEEVALFLASEESPKELGATPVPQGTMRGR